MSIGAICHRDVVYVHRDVTVSAAAKLMRHYHVGSLVVVDEQDGKRVPVGVITDRDIVVKVAAMNLNAAAMTVGDVMAPDGATAPASLGLIEAVALMRLRGLRRLPVVDGENGLVGIVTIDDLLRVLAQALADVAHVVSQEPQKYWREGCGRG